MKEQTMNGWTIGILGIVALAAAGCETLSEPQQVANAEAQRSECNTVRLSSAAKQLRMDSVRGYQANADDSMAETEGQLALGRIKLNEPRALRNPVAPLDSATSKAQREC
jgi:hypothetical protein